MSTVPSSNWWIEEFFFKHGCFFFLSLKIFLLKIDFLYSKQILWFSFPPKLLSDLHHFPTHPSPHSFCLPLIKNIKQAKNKVKQKQTHQNRTKQTENKEPKKITKNSSRCRVTHIPTHRFQLNTQLETTLDEQKTYKVKKIHMKYYETKKTSKICFHLL